MRGETCATRPPSRTARTTSRARPAQTRTSIPMSRAPRDGVARRGERPAGAAGRGRAAVALRAEDRLEPPLERSGDALAHRAVLEALHERLEEAFDHEAV